MNSSTNMLEKSRSVIQDSILVRKRDGSVCNFDDSRIKNALKLAFKSQRNVSSDEALDPFIKREIELISHEISQRICSGRPDPDSIIEIESIQDLVEVVLMQYGHYHVAKSYILYRNERSKIRSINEKSSNPTQELKLIK
jgi:ribonucleoside-diphosphate reductase alpha chain